MTLVYCFLVNIAIAITVISFLPSRFKGIGAIVAVALSCATSSYIAISALIQNPFEVIFQGSLITNLIPVRVDALSAIFILTINFTFITGTVYGHKYMLAYIDQSCNLAMHWSCIVVAHSALVAICAIQNSLVFLITWEIMAISVFVMIIFEHYKFQTLKAGLNYLVQSHLCILFITISFIVIYSKTQSFDFKLITEFAANSANRTAFIVMMLFFIGFSFKAGFVPFHTWLPYAHPAAPSHVSGIMSGVVIKIGIYGILRMITLIRVDYLTTGYIILVISVISGIYGVMLAIIQHNIKKLLAYHSIENIGIIGIGIGIGCIGLGKGLPAIAMLGFAGSILHVVNHSLFKSLLFFSAGNIYQSSHVLDIEQLGGLGKKTPINAFLFLIGSLAICGLPPFNGFVSEFLVYSGLFNGLKNSHFTLQVAIITSVFGLALIGGLAMLCFTKAFGIIFLGTPRHHLHGEVQEASKVKLIPMIAISVVILFIGLAPAIVLKLICLPVAVIVGQNLSNNIPVNLGLLSTLKGVGLTSIIFISVGALMYFIRKKIISKRENTIEPTWGCGYVGTSNKLQYTANSFTGTYQKLASPVLNFHRFRKEIKGIFPGKVWFKTHSGDKLEEILVNFPVRQFKRLINKLVFLQSGNLQFYITYGIVFILLMLCIPTIYNAILDFIQFIKNM